MNNQNSNAIDIERQTCYSDGIEQENSNSEATKRLIILDPSIPSEVVSLFGWKWAMIVIITFNVRSNIIALWVGSCTR